MTWAIQPTNTERPAQGPDIAPPTNWQGFGAAVNVTWQDTDVFMQRQRQVIAAQDELAAKAITRLGPDGIGPIIADFNRKATEMGLPERVIPEGATADEIIGKLGANGSEKVLEAARAAAEMDPDAWADLDVSDETLQAQLTERRAAERRANEEALALSPNPLRNSLLGGLAGSVADPVNLALAPFGGIGGSLWRVMLAEGALGAAAEGIQFPARQRVAEELDLPEPSLAEALTFGALGGAILGGAIEAVPRAIRAARYLAATRRTPEILGLDHIRAEGSIRAAEVAIDTGENPLDAVADVLRSAPPPEYIPPPLVLTPEMRSVTARTPDPTPLAPDPITTESLPPLPGNAPTTPGETAAMAERAINKASPRGRKPMDLSTFVVRRGGIWKGDDRGEIAALQYKRPGFVKNTLFARSAAGDNGGGLPIDMMREAAEEAGYLQPGSTINDFLDALADDVTKRNKRYPIGEVGPTSRKTYSPDYVYDPQEAFLSKQPSETGFFVAQDPLGEGVIWDTNVEREFDEYLATNWPTVKFQPREIAEMKRALSIYGGEAEDLVVSVLSREQDFAELPPKEALKYEERWGTGGWEDAFFGRTVTEDAGLAGQGDGLSVGPVADAEATGSGGTGAGRDYGLEATPAGQQAVIPGSRVDDSAARRAARLKAEAEVKALQSKQRRLNQVRVEDEVDGLFAQKQADIFDDLMSPQAQRFMDENLQAMRSIADEADVPVAAVADDGRALNSLRDVLDEIDDTDTLAREFDLCRFGGGEE